MHAPNAVESQICDDKELEVCSITALFARRITSVQHWKLLKFFVSLLACSLNNTKSSIVLTRFSVINTL